MSTKEPLPRWWIGLTRSEFERIRRAINRRHNQLMKEQGSVVSISYTDKEINEVEIRWLRRFLKERSAKKVPREK